MKFEDLISMLAQKSFHEIRDQLFEGSDQELSRAAEYVECYNNIVYVDDDFDAFLTLLGAEITDYGCGYTVIETTRGNIYELPYEERQNRHDTKCANEIVIFFNHDQIYDVTDQRKSS